mmetsp:Transcript_37804/g.78489  ORF Transcript_37804/g.78489 Transcript_37804/m.78489 type:complete len:112 (-) Transcript_37804:295-630(-)
MSFPPKIHYPLQIARLETDFPEGIAIEQWSIETMEERKWKYFQKVICVTANFFSQSIIQSENTIVHIVGPWSRADQLKHFTIVQWITAINRDASSDENQNGAGIATWLHIG